MNGILARPWHTELVIYRRRLTSQLRRNLRARVALGIGLPILLALALLSLVHYWRERHLLEEQARLTAAQFGQVIKGGLWHTMLVNDTDMIVVALRNIRERETIERAQIVNLSGAVLADSATGEEAGQIQHVVEPGCMECHRLAPQARPTAAVLSTASGALRVAVPLDNEPECSACHSPEAVHLGILLVDVPLRILWPHVLQNLQVDLAISAAITLLMTAAVYWLVHRLVVRRVETFRRPLAEYAQGNFGVRLPASASADEIGELALAFNRMADQLERHIRAEQERSAVRQRAIVEERERIARELHDGLAQVLGYVNTKATAIRFLLKKGQPEAAEKHLAQLEEAARGLFVDVREAILGLKMTSASDVHLPAMLTEYVHHFSQLCDLPVEVEIAPSIAKLSLAAETELQLLRIVQEALSNVRKHAAASRACVRVTNGGPTLELTVSDDGTGFDSEHARQAGRPHFGLSTMRERAEAIGAEFSLDSQPGAGTQITVRMKTQENALDAHPGRR
ncbi:MAG TPA: sensor histidine kinase [Anaerolineales bacterium]|nr:sensor histidine kinase [Anaerolineales bacterium]